MIFKLGGVFLFCVELFGSQRLFAEYSICPLFPKVNVESNEGFLADYM